MEEVLYFAVQCPLFTGTSCFRRVFCVCCVNPTIQVELLLPSVHLSAVAFFVVSGCILEGAGAQENVGAGHMVLAWFDEVYCERGAGAAFENCFIAGGSESTEELGPGELQPGLLWEGTCCCPKLWRLVRLERADLQKHVRHAVSNLCGKCAALVPARVHVNRVVAQGGKWCPPALLFLGKSPQDPCSSSTCSLPYTGGIFPSAVSLLCLLGADYAVFLRARILFPLILPFLPELSPPICEVPSVKPH